MSATWAPSTASTRFRATLLERAEKMDPKWLEAPREDYGHSLSSLENYVLTEEPVPPRE